MRLLQRPGMLVAALGAGLWIAWFPGGGAASPPSAADPRKGEALARRSCSTCHAFPSPEVLPQASWRRVVVKMALIRDGKGMPAWGEAAPSEALSSEDLDVLAYYEARAPVALPTPVPWPAPSGPPRFVSHPITFKEALTPEPAVSNVRLADLDGDGRLDLLACDMRQGVVLKADPAAPERGATPIATIPHPDHISVVDFQGNRRPDLLVADLGGFFPSDHEQGSAVWLRSRPGGGYAPFTLGNLPRVADVEAADFDGDGRLDLLVAGFGWWRKGGLFLFLNRTSEGGQPSFERKAVDSRAGPIHVTPADLDGNGTMDFVTVIAQEQEAVVAFLGDGAGSFQPRTLYAAPSPTGVRPACSSSTSIGTAISTCSSPTATCSTTTC